jgi:CHAD domain-containing protein
LLGEVRDRSVQIGRLNELAPLVSRDPAGQAAIDFLVQALGHQRDVALEAVRHELTTEHHAHLTSLLGRWRQPPFTEAADRDAAAVVTYVDAAREHVMEAISRARMPGAADVEVHDARKAGKRYRYAVELATPELGGSAVVTLDRARALQEELGRYQDSVVGVALVSEAGEAAQLPPAVAQGIELLLEALTDAGHKAREAALQLSV